MIRNNDVRLAVRRALTTSAIAAGGLAVLPVHAQQAPNNADATTQQPQEVIVTGTRIRRVDTETANPVITISSAQIAQTGAQTVGELLMQLPAINGAATNPSVNNGGGFGESYIELRGLDAKRTLILIDGRRVGLIGAPQSLTSAVDINQIPLEIIDHVEVLKEGAGAVYGSDAIAGVVNFITKKNTNGLEVGGDFGKTTHGDGPHHDVYATFGETTDKFSFMLSGRDEQFSPVLQSRRAFSQYALYASYSSVFPGGSSRSPTGRIYLPAGNPYGCDSVTKITGTDGTAPADYRCFNSSGPNDDHYNYAPVNYLITPQDRAQIFSKVNYKINDNVQAYGSMLYSRTHSGFQQASLPFDSTLDNVVVSPDSLYNVLGTGFGGLSGAYPDAEWRLLGLGPRRSDTQTDSVRGTFGVKGSIPGGDWTWDLFSQYGQENQFQRVDGYFFSNQLSAALGPSMLVNGAPACVGTAGDPASVIAGCTPLNIFAANDPTSPSFAAQSAIFQSLAANYNTDYTFRTEEFALDLTGTIWHLPAGDLEGAAGIDRIWQQGSFQADQIVIAQPPLYLSCEISQEACTGNSEAHYGNTDFYGEAFIPLLKDLPGVHALNLDVGIRYSDYTIFQNTTRATVKLEYRPIKDLLVRATFAQVYRAPTILDIAAAPRANAPTYIDPCDGLTAARVAANPGLANACVGVPRDGSFQEPNGQITGLLKSNRDLKPETGEVWTTGIVYDPSYVPGLSFDIDYWNYQINNVITQVDPNYIVPQCISGKLAFCNYIVRYPSTAATAGQIEEIEQPTLNLGSLSTDGMDLGLHEILPTDLAGTFKFSLDMQHVLTYKNLGTEYAGTYSTTFGNDTKWRALASLDWAFRGFDAYVSEQWIGSLDIPVGFSNSPNIDPEVDIPNIFYTNLTLGYTFAPTNTHIQAGIQNLMDKQPPIFYQNNVINANTDVSTYQVLGREYFLGIVQKF
ncbi:MAG: TonB-dependent receptor plug domain-containing protein [Steroidobacteraceae bacterium]